MLLRQTPGDFIVTEQIELDISKDKLPYKLYLIEKTKVDTFSVLRALSEENHIPFSEIGVAGLKDKHALTKQHITIPSEYNIKIIDDAELKTKFLGFVKDKLKLGDLRSNEFKITIRDLKKDELDKIIERINSIKEVGVPNYFDSQRFGSVFNNEFIAKLLIKKDYERAVKIYLTLFDDYESERIKEEKLDIAKNWTNLAYVRINNPQLATVVNEYTKTNSWLDAYKKIPARIRLLIISAYQSYLWNECVKELLIRTINKGRLYAMPYKVGELIFYESLSPDELETLSRKFSKISDELKPVGIEKEIINKVLDKEKITLADFKIKKETGSFFKTKGRTLLLKPAKLEVSEPTIDGLNDDGEDDTFKLVISFVLLKGNYATVVIKRLFDKLV